MSTQKTAAQTYAAHRSDIARLLDVLEMELARLDADAKASPKDWGIAGNLEKVRGDLVNTIAFLSRKDASEVESLLQDE